MGSAGSAWHRIALWFAVGALSSAVAGPFLPAGLAPLGRSLVQILAPLSAASACLGARAAATSAGRKTWLLLAVGATLASVGQALAVRAEVSEQFLGFHSVAFQLLVAFHLIFAGGAVLALRPAQEPRLALEIALDGLLVLLAKSEPKLS